MNEGLEYAQMLEIPVSTVSVVKKRSLFSRKAKPAEDLKDRVVDSVNERMGETPFAVDEGNGYVITEDLTAPVKTKKKSSVAGKILFAEGIAACAVAAGIFLTNVFIPDTVINSFVGGLTTVKQQEAAYNEFTLTPVVSELSEAEIAVTDDGVIHFTQKATVYPVCDGEIASVTETDGLYTVKIAHTSTFCSVFTGLDTVYYKEGDSVKSNVPFAYSKGENEVRVSMYDGDTVLNCYTLSGAVPVWNS
ncbi:MAG: M23 family metallopeptidase [Clostridia bacterium]|nr:M23 family metallopeptidase [Clostridia bacterium]